MNEFWAIGQRLKSKDCLNMFRPIYQLWKFMRQSTKGNFYILMGLLEANLK